MKLVIPFAAAAAIFALPALAQDVPAKAPSEVSAKEEVKEEKKICRRVPSETGSRKMERVCLTAGEWRNANNQ